MAKPPAAFEALEPPPDAILQGGVEVLRAVVVDGGLHVSLRTAFEDSAMWGVLLADVARHAARAFAGTYAVDEQEALDLILDTMAAEFDDPTDPGRTTALS
jgi:hypothetical protein